MKMVEISNSDIDQIESEIGTDIKFEESHRDVLKDNTTFDVQACPGSGKTTLLAAKLLILSKKWKSKTKGICVLSHTNVAKDVIIKKLENHPTGWKFLKHPHFIGTIQEFVNKFFAIPYIRDQGWPISAIDSDIYSRKAMSKCDYGLKFFLSKNRINTMYKLLFSFDEGSLKVTLPFNFKNPKADSCLKLLALKNTMTEEGYFQYRDMYELAKAQVYKNPLVKDLLQKRFGYLFIDEMQDTQKFQDDFIQQIFPLTESSCQVQRFGDCDQAIYDGIDGVQNDSYKAESCKYVINKSHRFTPCICNLITGISQSKTECLSSTECANNGNHTACEKYGDNVIFTYDSPEKIKDILKEFGDHVNEKLDGNSDRIVKAIGAIGKSEHLNINSYCEFDKSKRKDKFIPKSHFEAIAYVFTTQDRNVNSGYSIIIASFVKFLHENDIEFNSNIKQDKSVNKTNLTKVLKDNGILKTLNKIIYNWMFCTSLPLKEDWNEQIAKLSEVLSAISNSSIDLVQDNYFLYPDEQIIEEYKNPEKFNMCQISDNLNIVINTIHGIKGETHDATLIFETQHGGRNIGSKGQKKFIPYLDMNELKENMVEKTKTVPSQKTLQKFMKLLYVGMSRPKKIVCVGANAQSIAGFEEELKSIGWKIQPV